MQILHVVTQIQRTVVVHNSGLLQGDGLTGIVREAGDHLLCEGRVSLTSHVTGR